MRVAVRVLRDSDGGTDDAGGARCHDDGGGRGGHDAGRGAGDGAQSDVMSMNGGISRRYLNMFLIQTEKATFETAEFQAADFHVNQF